MERWIVFHSRGEVHGRSTVGLARADGSEVRHLKFDVAGQVSWGYGPAFRDGERIILISFDTEKTWERTCRSSLWLYNIGTGDLTEIARENPPGAYVPACALLPGEERVIVNPMINGKQTVMIMDLDGSNQQAVTRFEDGFSYCVSLSPDAKRVAFHVAEAPNYHIVVTNLDGSGRTVIAADPDHLYFGPTWSHDGEWLLYLDCHSPTDPGHEWADLCIGRPDGSEHRVVTQGQSHWFTTAYGGPDSTGGGSNMPRWSPEAMVATYTRTLAGSRPAWRHNPGSVGKKEFRLDYLPEEARGGTEICVLDPFGAGVTALTTLDSGARGHESRWDFRTAWSPDGRRIAFCRAFVGQPSELWVMNADGSEQRFLTRGLHGLGADHPMWV